MTKIFTADDLRHTKAHFINDGEVILETVQDISGILELNRQQRDADKERTGFLGDIHHIGRLPYTVIDDLNKKGIMRGFAILDPDAFAQWLNTTEIGNACKTYRGTV